jgi:hypothetical protein
MSTLKPRELTSSKKLAAIDGNMSNVEHLQDIVGQMLLVSTSEIDRLIRDLKGLRGKLEEGSHRIQTEIVEYVSLSQSTAQLTTIVSDSVAQIERGSGAPSNNIAEQAVALTPEDANSAAGTSPVQVAASVAQAVRR